MENYMLPRNWTSFLSENNTAIAQYRSRYSVHLTVWFAVVNTTAALGAIGNLLLLCVIYRLPDWARHSGSHILLANLAFVYMFMCFPLVPLSSSAVYGGFAIPTDYCRTQRSIGLLIYTVATWTDLALAVNRIYAIFFPRKLLIYRGRRMSALVVAVVWLLGLAGTLPFWLDVAGHFQPFRLNECIATGLTSVGKLLVVVFLNVPYCLTGLAALAVLTKALVSRYARRRSAAVNTVRAGRQAREYWLLRQQLIVAKPIFVSFLWCSLCVVPTFIVSRAFPAIALRYGMLDTWLKTLVTLGYVGNPLIVFKMNQEYRRGLNATMTDLQQQCIRCLSATVRLFW